MKKIMSCILVILFMLLSFSVSVYGLSENPIKNADTEINPIQFWLYKQVRKDKSIDCVTFYDDLPGDTPVIEPSPGLIHTDFISVISVYGTNVSKETFNVTAEYYHQFMTIGITPSIDIDTGVSASISPKIECSSIDVNLECKPA